MTAPQQPPVMHGYSQHPPRGDWAPPPAKRRGLSPWLIAIIAVGGPLLIGAVVVVADKATLKPDEFPGDAKRACVEEYVPAKLGAMADPKSARYAGVTVRQDAGAYVVAGRVTADRISNDTLDGLPNRYRFECSMKRVGDAWVPNFATVLPA